MGDTTLPTFDLTTSEAISISNAIMIGSIIVLIIIVAFCFSIYLYLKFYWSDDIEDQSIVSWRRRQLVHQRRKARQGLDAVALQSLPVVVYDTKDFKEGLECVVCLSEVSKGEEVRLLPKCNHGFHVNCIDVWFKSHITCPLCRNPVISTHISEVQDDNSSDSSDYYSNDDDDRDSDSDSDSDSHNGSDSTPRAMEVHIFPANVLFWGNEAQFRSFEQASNVVDASSSSVNRPRHQQDMVIEIPLSYELCDGCLSLSSPPRLEEAKTPGVRRLGSLKRLLSLGKRVVVPSPRASSSRDVCQQI